MKTWLKGLTSGTLSGVIAAGGTLTGAISEMPADSDIATVSGITWLAIGAFGIVAAAKDWQAFMMKSPKDTP